MGPRLLAVRLGRTWGLRACCAPASASSVMGSCSIGSGILGDLVAKKRQNAAGMRLEQGSAGTVPWHGSARWAALLTPSPRIRGRGDAASIAALPGPARGAPRPLWRGGRPAAVYNRAQLHPVGGRGRRAPRPHARGLVPINYHPSMSPCPLGAAPRPCRGARPVDTGRWPRAACSCPQSHAAVISGDVDTGEPSPSRRAPRC